MSEEKEYERVNESEVNWVRVRVMRVNKCMGERVSEIEWVRVSAVVSGWVNGVGGGWGSESVSKEVSKELIEGVSVC